MGRSAEEECTDPECWGCQTCPGCGEQEHLSPSPAGPRCRDCTIEAMVAAASCEECGRFVGNANGRVMFGLFHAESCSQWTPYREEDWRLAAQLGERMLYGNGEDLTRLMKLCANKGRPELLMKLERREIITGVGVDDQGEPVPLQAPREVNWAICFIDANPVDMFADLIVGDAVLGPVNLPRRFDVIPARQGFLPTVKPSMLLPEDAHVRLYGWPITFDELFAAE